MSPGPSAKTAAAQTRAAADAATTAVQSHSTSLDLPLIGTVQLPGKGGLAYCGALAGLTLLGLMDWPIALVVGVGHLLAQQHGHAVLEEFGEGLDDA